MRVVAPAIEIRPDGGHGIHVFAGANAHLLEDRYDIDRADIITFNHNAKPSARHAEVKAKIRARAATRPPGYYRSVIRRMHGYPQGAQDGSRVESAHEEFEAFDGRLAEDVTVANYSCSNAATIGHHPDGDMSLADAQRDALCALGYVHCQTSGHLIAGHGDYEIADRAGGVWRPLARIFRGDGTRNPQVGGEEILPKGHSLLPVLFRLVRKLVDPDGPDGPLDMIGFWAVWPWLESREELIANWLDPTAQVIHETDRFDPPTVGELQIALAAEGFMPRPTAGHGLGTFGPITRAAVREFQRTAGLKIDGIPGPKTWAALRTLGHLN